MNKDKVATLEKDGSVYVKMDDLLDGLYTVCNHWQLVYSDMPGVNETEAVHRLIGMIDMCKGMEFLHDQWKLRYGLT